MKEQRLSAEAVLLCSFVPQTKKGLKNLKFTGRR